MTTNENEPLPDPTAPHVIEVANNDYLAKLQQLRRDGWHVESIRVTNSGYRLTVRR